MQRISTPSATHPRQGGAVIIVVVSLMAALAFLGFFFFTFADQEQSNARNYASAESYAIDPDPVFDFALQQVLVDTPQSLTNSALYGSRWSLLSHVVGPMDGTGAPQKVTLYSGGGIELVPDDPSGNTFSLDYNRDGTAEADETDFVLNFSPLANGGSSPLDTNPDFRFNPAAGYTYPDINSLFLAMDYEDPIRGRVVKPSFTLPGLFPSLRSSGFSTWHRSGGANPNQVLRPHRALTSRYITNPNGVAAQSGNRDRVISPFPFGDVRLGAWETLTPSDDYQLDFDADGDGVDDSIALDLDHPLIDFPGGRQGVPIYFWKIVDLDGLFNLNAHGQIPDFTMRSRGGTARAKEHIYDASDWVHSSNLGLSPAEINPAIGLTADPQTDLDPADQAWATLPHKGFIADRSAPPSSRDRTSGALTRLQVANLELAMMLVGRPDISDVTTPASPAYLTYGSQLSWTGKYGTDGIDLRAALDTLSGATFPAPGLQGVDDDRDANSSTEPGGGVFYDDPYLGVEIPGAIHPLDFLGLGDAQSTPAYTRTVSALGKVGSRVLGGGGLVFNPLRWPVYPASSGGVGLWQDQGSSPVYPTYRDALSGALQPGSPVDFLVDEPDEVNLDRNLLSTDDAPFEPSEIASLQLSNADWHGVGMESRLRNLLPLNFEYSNNAADIRKRFSTESWDRRELGFAPVSGGIRAWEFNDGGSFPPNYTTPSQHEAGFISPYDPFRPEVRRLITVDSNGTSPGRPAFPQFRLDINRILSDDSLLGSMTGQDAFDEFGNPRFRRLTPHVENLPAGATIEPMVHINRNVGELTTLGYTPPHPVFRFDDISTDPAVQEWWARYDRQRLARDIYVLLYTLSGYDGNPAMVDQTDLRVQQVDRNIAREMAQFAVNYVDALDRDNVITKFEYDPDLTDGWNDNPGEFVFGIEAQSLVCSEALLVETTATTNDLAQTLHDERNDNHRFLFLELRNTSPFPVRFGDDTWRLVRIAEDTSAMPPQEAPVVAALLDDNTKTVPPGGNFIIGCHDGTVVNGNGELIGTALYVDHTGGNELEMAIPKEGPTIPDNLQVVTEVVDYDLTGVDNSGNWLHEPGTTFQIFDPAYTTAGGTTLVEATSGGGGGAITEFWISLQRRRHLGGNGAGEAAEWVEVDRIRVEVQPFTATDGNGQGDLASKLSQIKSVERVHPFTSDTDDHPGQPVTGAPTPDPTPLFHSLRHASAVARNSANDVLFYRANIPGSLPMEVRPTQLPLWHPHFDRDFASVAELLSVPLYGYRSSQETAQIVLRKEGGTVANLVQDYRLTGHRTAQVRFLYPDPGEIPAASPWNVVAGESYRNRWYRLFAFLETTPRSHDLVSDLQRYHRRTPGRINLNTIRHEHVLAGLIDDDIHHDSIGDVNAPTTDQLTASRNWMDEFLAARDGDDLPGTPKARPFKPLGVIDQDDPDASVESTVLRHHAASAPANLPFLGLFEARGGDDLLAGQDTVDYHTRHRLLGKVVNNSTTRSHVFAIWCGFAIHDAHQTSGGQVQVGGRMEGAPVYRQFLVVDMSRLEEAYDPESGTFDFRKFIIHRQMLP